MTEQSDGLVGKGRDTDPAASSRRWRPVVAGAVGNALEWYDYGVYGYLATVIATEFFGGESKGILLAFLTFGVGFLMRPLGAVVIGHVGDRIGRRGALLMTIVMMSGATFLIGILPTYHQIGVMASVLLVLLRLVQGFSAGGEFGGAVAYMVEHASPNRRGLYGSWQQFTVIGGMFLGSGISGIVSRSMSESALHAWGWRLPFLFGIVLMIPALYLRYSAGETPKFRTLQAEGKVAKKPVKELLSQHWRTMVKIFTFEIGGTVAFYTFITYLPNYLKNQLDVSLPVALMTTFAELALAMLLIPLFGLLADRIGRKPLFWTSTLIALFATYPLFWLLRPGNGVVIVVVAVTLAVPLALRSGPLGAYMSEMFPTEVRYSAISIPYNICIALFGGFAPFIGSALIEITSNRLAPTFYVMAAALVTTVSLFVLPETRNRPLT